MFARFRSFANKIPNMHFTYGSKNFHKNKNFKYAAIASGSIFFGSVAFYKLDGDLALRRFSDYLLQKFEIKAAIIGKPATIEKMQIKADAKRVQAAQCQPNVTSQLKSHALYLWIRLTQTSDKKKCAKIVADLPKIVEQLVPPDMKDEYDEIWAGVGFSSEFYAQAFGKKPIHEFAYPYRRGVLGDLPNTDGDIFIHAKSHNTGKLFEMTQLIKKSLPPGSVHYIVDTYSFLYKNGRDLSGFIDGTENPADDETRYRVAVEKATGGSYCVTQKWVHYLDYIDTEQESNLEGFIGRTRADSVELKTKPPTSHIARMTSGPDVSAKKPVEIVRQSMPYGNLGREAGLFFIAFAESPKNFDYMLDRMVGATEDTLSDDIMRISRCIMGNYWYFPSIDELKNIA